MILASITENLIKRKAMADANGQFYFNILLLLQTKLCFWDVRTFRCLSFIVVDANADEDHENIT